MIPSPKGWASHRGGRELLFVHPRGIATLCYQERMTPLRPASELVREALASIAFVPDAIPSAQPRVTDEGEDATLMTISGTLQGKPAQLYLGFVFLEDQFSRILAVSHSTADSAEVARVVEDCLVRDTYLLGIRPRRVLHARPAGWLGLPR